MGKQAKSGKQDRGMTPFPVVFAAGYVPLVVHKFILTTGYDSFDWAADEMGTIVDVFLFCKMVLIIAAGALAAGILLWHGTKKKGRTLPASDSAFLPLLFYVLLCAMSALFSSNKPWVSTGAPELMEPVWCLFAYALLCYYTCGCVRSKEDMDRLLGLCGPGAIILLAVGLFQTFGLDLFSTAAGRVLATSPAEWGNEGALTVNVADGTAYSTLYNQNYLSSYCALAIPVILGMLLAAKKTWQRAVLAAAGVMALVCMAGSRSSSGWIGLAAALLVLVAVLCSRRKKTSAVFLGGLGACAVLGILLCVLTPVGEKASTLFVGTFRLEDACPLRSIDTGDEAVRLDIGGNDLLLSFDYDEDTGLMDISCMDADGETLTGELVPDGDTVSARLDEETYAGCTVTPTVYDGRPCMGVEVADMAFLFSKGEDGTYYFYTPFQKWVKVGPVKSAGLFRDDAMSGRGRIWNNTIPLLGKYLLLGCGANTYAMAYPQKDYVYAFYTNTMGVWDAKAHSWYLMQWVENGLVALLCLLAFFLLYLIRSVRLLRRADPGDPLARTAAGLFAGLLSYLVVGLANDSTVCTAPVFWVLLGLGMAVNRILAEREKVSVPVAESVPTNAGGGNASNSPAGNTGTPGKQPSKKQKQSRKKKRGKK